MKPLVVYHANCADGFTTTIGAIMEWTKCLESLLKPTKCVCGEPSDTNVVHRSDAPCYYKSQPAQQDPRDEALEDAKQFEAVVVASDHPDVMGGIVWSDCELRWINEKLHTAKAAGMREAAKICYDIDREYEGEDVSAIWCVNAILKAAESVEANQWPMKTSRGRGRDRR